MNCPVCERSLAPTLSICPTCGAMRNDTVREELRPKISSGPLPGVSPRLEPKAFRPPQPARVAATPPPSPVRTVTAGLVAPKTSPTLVDFQNKNATLPDWRIQLQNAVQQRKGGPAATAAVSTEGPVFASNGGAALKAEVISKREMEDELGLDTSDPIVAKAMLRIAESRKAFLEPIAQTKKRALQRPFGVVAPTANASAAAAPARIITPPKPTIVPPPVAAPSPVLEKRDTNKLPPIEKVMEETAGPIAETAVKKVGSGPLATEFPEIKRIQIRVERPEETDEAVADPYDEEIEDLATFSMRFGAGLFDMIIAGFGTMLLLSPLAFTNGNWFTSAGLLTFAGAFAIVSFTYMTLCLGFFGKTMGMRLFSLELVDAIENEYPTLRQAAVNSAVFILSLGVCGAGFVTAFFNEERRALHDLLSGTILVREF